MDQNIKSFLIICPSAKSYHQVMISSKSKNGQKWVGMKKKKIKTSNIPKITKCEHYQIVNLI